MSTAARSVAPADRTAGGLATPGVQTAPWLQRQLGELLQQRGHAWLLQGPSGLGQYALAQALAEAWLCDSPQPDATACGHCESCHAIAVRTHPDLCVLMPETQMLERGWPLDEKLQKELDDKKRKPSKEIRVEAMRDTIEFSQRTSSRGRGKVVVVYPAERMNPVTANALLKTLEEPPGDVRFVLASEAAHLLLPTIRSRCMTHTMRWPTEQESLAWLQLQGLAEADASGLLHAAGGRPDDALAWHRVGMTARTWQALPEAARAGQVQPFAQLSPAQVIGVLQKLCHDALSVRGGGTPRFFDAAALPAATALPDWRRLTQWGKDLAQDLRSAEHPYQPGLFLEDLVGKAAQVLRGTGRPAARSTR